MNHSKSTLAQNLIAKRKEHKLTQVQTSEMLNIKHKRYAAWEEDRAAVPHTFLSALAEMYKTTVDELLKAKEGECDTQVCLPD